MDKVRYYMNWWFRDLTERRGKYVIAEVPNLPLVIFMISLVVSVAVYPGPTQTVFTYIAYTSLGYWGLLEYRGGRSRFRKLLGALAMLSVAVAFLLRL